MLTLEMNYFDFIATELPYIKILNNLNYIKNIKI